MAPIKRRRIRGANWFALGIVTTILLGMAGAARALSAATLASPDTLASQVASTFSRDATPSEPATALPGDLSASTKVEKPGPSASPGTAVTAGPANPGGSGGTTTSRATTTTTTTTRATTTATTAAGTTTTTTTTTAPPPPPPPPFVAWETNDYYEGSASDFCAKMDSARQAAGAAPFASCGRGGSMVAHAQAMAEAHSVWDGDGSNISGSDTSITKVVSAFMASPSHKNQIVGDGSAALSYAGCVWWKRAYQTAADQPIVERTRVFCAAQFDYP